MKQYAIYFARHNINCHLKTSLATKSKFASIGEISETAPPVRNMIKENAADINTVVFMTIPPNLINVMCALLSCSLSASPNTAVEYMKSGFLKLIQFFSTPPHSNNSFESLLIIVYLINAHMSIKFL